MTNPAPTPIFRLRIPCADEREFRERFAPRYAAAGVFVPTERLQPVGSRVLLKIELRDGSLGRSGEALVAGHGFAGGRSGMTLRLAAAAQGNPPPAPAEPPRPLAEELFGGEAPAPEEVAAAKPLVVQTSEVRLKLRNSEPRELGARGGGRPDAPGQPSPDAEAEAQEGVEWIPPRRWRRLLWAALAVLALLAGALALLR